MKTRQEIRAELQASNPTTNVNGVVYAPGDAIYEELMERWIDAVEQTPPPIVPDAKMHQVKIWLARNGINPASIPQLISSITEDGPERWEALARWDSEIPVPADFPMVQLLWQQLGHTLNPQRTFDAAWQEILAI